MGEDEPATCPKCGAPRDPRACPRCGLSANRMDRYAASRDDVPEVLAAAWRRALDGWDDQAGHDELLRLVSQHDAYAWAAGRYRTRAGDAIGDRQLDRLQRAAEATMYASAARPVAARSRRYSTAIVVVVLLAVLVASGLLFASVLRKRQQGGFRSPSEAQPAPRLAPSSPPHAPAAPSTPAAPATTPGK